MKIAIAGATGVLGRALIPLLLEDGHRVLGLVRDPARASTLLPGGIQLLESDLLTPGVEDRLSAALEGCDAVMHLATAIPRDGRAAGAWENNSRIRTEGTKRLLEASARSGVARYVQQSITMAYPDGGEAWIGEEQPLDDSPARAAICGPVIAMEGLVRQWAVGPTQWCILRGGSFVGPGTAQDALIRDLRSGRSIVAGRGDNFVSLIHVADMAAACRAAVVRAPQASILNIVDEPMREGEYLDRLADHLGVPRPARDKSLNPAPSWRCSNEHARRQLGWSPRRGVLP